jgi:hypothetical protein
VQLDAYRKKKAAKKEKKDVSSISGLNFAKNEDHQNALGERVASKPPFLVADGDEPKGDDSMKMTFTTTPTTNEEEEETANTTETFAFTMAPDAVRYSNGNTKGEEDIVAHASPMRPAAPDEQPRRGIEEEEGVAAFMSPPPPRFSFDESYNAAGGSMMEEEATPPVKMNMRGFEEQEDADIDRKKMSSLDESFDPEEYVNRFVTPEKKMAPPTKQKKATIDVPMDELEAIFRPTKKKDGYDDADDVPYSFSKFLEREKNKNEEQRLSSFEREILESKQRKEQMGGESSISDMLGRGSTLTPLGGISTGNGMSKLEQDEITSLQNMIDDLTTEKLSLKRGMDKNQKIIESLMEENESLTSAFNNAKNRSTALENELNKLSSEMMLHSSVQQSISNDRDASRRGYIETRERANELAREVVELEEVVLEYKSKLFLYENTQTDALERSKELERALYVANEDRVYYQNLAEAMNEERREMQRRVGQSNAIQALIESGDVPIVEMLQSWLKQVQAKPVSQEQNVSSSLRSAEAEQQNEFLEMSTSEADFVCETRTSEAVATTKELIDALTRLASGDTGGSSNNNPDESAATSDGEDNDDEDENGEEDGVVIDEAQIRLITSIHELLAEMEKETAIFRVKLKDAERREMGLRAANAALESRLARSAPQAKTMNTNTKESEGRDDVIAAMRRINAGSAEPTPRTRENNSSGGFRFRTGLVPDDD